MFKAAGFTDADLARPVIGIANTWIEIGPCNYHLRELAGFVREGIRAAGATAMEFNTVSISDGITMGTPGMRMSLVSREVIADSIELVAAGNRLDGVIALVGCDKTIPGAAMALARLDLPGLVLYGGSIAPGRVNGRDVTIQDVFEAVGAHAAGRLSIGRAARSRESRLSRRRRLRRPVHGQHDGGRLRVPRTSPMGSASVPALDPAKRDVAVAAGRLVADLVRRKVTARADPHARRVRERHHVGRRHRRLDQRRAAPAGDRARGGRGSRSRRPSTRSTRGCPGLPISSRPAGCRDGSASRGRHARWSRSGSRTPDCSRPTRSPSAAGRSARKRSGDVKRPARTSCARSSAPLVARPAAS